MKNKIINIRVTEEEKERLIKLAKKEKKTVSMYLVQKGLSEGSGTESVFLPERVETINLINELWHRVQKCNDRELKIDIDILYWKIFSGLQKGESYGK